MKSTLAVIVAIVAVSSFSTAEAFSAARLGATVSTANNLLAMRQRNAVASYSNSATTNTNTKYDQTTQLFAESNTNTIVPGIGEEGCNLPPVSGVNTMDNLAQASIVAAIFFSLGAGTYLFSSGLGLFTTFLGDTYPSQYEFFRNTWPVTLGLVFSLAGVTHFTVKKEYENIFPSEGAWGIWNVPGGREFHVAWTGAAELAGGLGLLASGVSSFAGIGNLATTSFLTSAGLESDAAAALFLLVLLVTPANIFMFTHGAKLPMEGEAVPLSFHAVRWVMQVILLGLLSQMGQETFRVLLLS